MAPTSFRAASMVNAAILNGKRISHTKGKNMSTSKASGQQQRNRKHQRIKAISVRMGDEVYSAFSQQKDRHRLEGLKYGLYGGF